MFVSAYKHCFLLRAAENENDRRTKRKERPYFLQIIYWLNRHMTWDAFDSAEGSYFYHIDKSNIRVEELHLPSGNVI